MYAARMHTLGKVTCRGCPLASTGTMGAGENQKASVSTISRRPVLHALVGVRAPLLLAEAEVASAGLCVVNVLVGSEFWDPSFAFSTLRLIFPVVPIFGACRVGLRSRVPLPRDPHQDARLEMAIFAFWFPRECSVDHTSPRLEARFQGCLACLRPRGQLSTARVFAPARRHSSFLCEPLISSNIRLGRPGSVTMTSNKAAYDSSSPLFLHTRHVP